MPADFYRISVTKDGGRRKGIVIIKPKFLVNPRTDDLMIRGGDFYAAWNPKTGLWSTDEKTVIDSVDADIDEAKKHISGDEIIECQYMYDSDSGSIDRWHKYVQKQMRDKYKPLDERIIFLNTDVKKSDYASKRLPYAIEEGDCEAYNELIGTLYEPEEREKIEWAIGAIISGDAKRIQKFEVLYGSAGTGKSTILNIIEQLFEGYTSTFNAKELASANNAFALESFKNGPLVSIQHDGDLSKIEDNTKLNSIVSHEMIEVNAKYTKLYKAKFNTFLFMGTNEPVKITNLKSGLIRRLIDVKPSGKKIPYKRYQELISQVKFELGAIAFRCLTVYEDLGESYYDNYIPTEMIAATNDFYDFIDHNYEEYAKSDMVTLTEAWKAYKEYCEFANAHQLPLRIMRTELANYFRNFEERGTIDGKRVRNLYSGFRTEKFENNFKKKQSDEGTSWLEFNHEVSLFDDIFAESPAQLASESGNPMKKWENVTTKLRDIDTKKLHWVKPDTKNGTLVTIDFDIRGKDGEKSFEKNVEAARKWPKTYAELSKSGVGIHLEYYYDGDPGELSKIFDDNIEIKAYSGNASLRRKLTKCNGLPIATLKPGSLPVKGEGKVINWDGIKNEAMLRNMIHKNLRKEYHPDTSSSINYISKLLDDAYASGLGYDVSDLEPAILSFALKSTHQADRCASVVAGMKFKSEKPSDAVTEGYLDDRITFADCEIYRPDEETGNEGLFLICWKYLDAPRESTVVMINPKPHEVEELFKQKLALFNGRKYDNHMMYARSLGYSNQRLYELSQEIINRHSGFFGEAYNISYTDVYDFCTEKMSLKKWEIKLGIHHQEMGIPWDKPAPKEKWPEIIEYCINDVCATEAVFKARQGDFMARKIQVDLVKLLHGDDINVTVNDTTNTLSKRIIFGKNTSPQSVFNWRDMSKPVGGDRYAEYREKFGEKYRFRVFDADGLPQYRDYIPGEELPEGWSILPFFKGYSCVMDYKKGKYVSTYLGENIGEGGRVYSCKGVYFWVWDGDISSQHPRSIIAEVLFGPEYTRIFEEIVEARVAVKHRDFERAGKLLGGALKPYLTEELAGDLAQALKIVINSIYGLTKAAFKNEFRDPRNFDNIVAKRGALFMTLLKQEVEKLGYTVCHIKTDSIKIPGADDFIKDFVVKFGREFGYEFETEGVFTKFALLNDAAYVAHEEGGGWITKADQFKEEKQPYLFKTLFSHEPYTFNDFCETKSVSEGALYLDMNENLPDVTEEEKLLNKLDKLAVTEPEKFLTQLEKQCTKSGADRDTFMENLRETVGKGHNLVFVGRVGRFTPVVAGAGGGVLYRVQNGKRYAVSGSTGYRWLESEFVEKNKMEDKIDKSYYKKLVDEAMDDIAALRVDGNEGEDGYGVDIHWFLSDEEAEFKVGRKNILPDFMNIPENVTGSTYEM